MRNAALGLLLVSLVASACDCAPSDSDTTKGNKAPEVAITEPEDGATLVAGAPVRFVGTATDPEDGALDGDSVTWTSDVEGDLGTGLSIEVALATEGAHTITLTATDSQGKSASASITVTVVANTPPVVTIESPSDGSAVKLGDPVVFTGSATDAEDGPLTGTALTWSSDVDGDLGSGESVTTALATAGAHTITLTATDSAGATASASIQIQVMSDLPPEVSIVSPADGAQYSRGETIAFECTAVDPEDGPIPNGDIVWTSDLDGQIGIGATVRTGLASAGTHTITCTATDSSGNTGSASVSIEVLDNFAPEVVIQSPADGSYFLSGSSIAFTGTATDPEDGPLTGTSLEWFASGMSIGFGGTVQTVLPDGDHLVELVATDSQGATARASITVHVVTNLPPVCVIQTPPDGASFPEGSTVTFGASCTDPDGTGPIPNTDIVWTSDLQGSLGFGASVTNALVTVGTHTIEVCATDTTDPTLQGCASITVTVVFNEPPTAAITAPADMSTVPACQRVALACSGTDPEGQPLAYTWESDREGVLGTGSTLNWAPSVSGTHVLTCTVTDAQGKTGTAQVTVTIDSPVAVILHPGSGEIRRPGVPVAFGGEACDTEDGPLNGASLVWTSDVDGQIGTGNAFSTTLSTGRHIITLTATDSQGNTGTDSIELWISSPPTVTITAPNDGASFLTTDTISFTATASDPEDGDLTPNIQWWTSATGDFATGGSTSLSLPPGKHVIHASVTDSAGETVTDSIVVYVTDGSPLVTTLVTGTQVNGVFVDPATGNYYVATNAGIAVYDPMTGQAIALYTTQNSTLPSNQINDILFLSDGTVMVATSSGLAVGCAPDMTGCSNYFDGDLALETSRMQALLELPDGRTLVGTADCMMVSNWATGQHRRFCRGDGGGDGLAGNKVRDLVYDAATGEVWIATDRGVSLLVPPPPPEVNNRSLFVFTTYDTTDGLASNDVRAVALAPSGEVYFATAGGVSHLVRQATGDVITNFTTADGLGSNNVRDVAVDVVNITGLDREVVWAATAGGLGRIDASLGSVVNITTADGLLSNDCRSVFVEPDHTKWVGHPTGLSFYRGW
ncbi:MAG: hypothetical protein D6729_08850 [Deltaproteobacteria bacterium]|nr:MAG: hypothetical protein D6729_08850 [Deltaproteobacteria bacterium]